MIHLGKLAFKPTQDIIFLGFISDSKDMSVRLTAENITVLIKECKKLKLRDAVKIQTVSEFVHKFVAAAPGFPLAPLYFKILEVEMNAALKRSSVSCSGGLRPCHIPNTLYIS